MVIVVDNRMDISDKDLSQVNVIIIAGGPIFLTVAASFSSLI